MARKALIINIVLCTAAIFCGALSSQKPWQVLYQQQVRTKAAVKEMRASEERIEDLTRQEVRYKSSLGKEELARERGLVKSSEKPIEIPDDVLHASPVGDQPADQPPTRPAMGL